MNINCECLKIRSRKRYTDRNGTKRLENGEDYEKLHQLYDSPDIIRVMKSRRLGWARNEARMGEKRRLYSVVVGKPEGKRPLGRLRRRWENNIKKDLPEVGVHD
jgi:hypothetical protein